MITGLTLMVVGRSLPLLVAALGVVTLSAQSPLRTPWGDPDLQGQWPSGSLIDIPFERPVELGTRAILADEEVAQRGAAVTNQLEAALSPPHWMERGRALNQASLIVDPSDGRLPPMTEDGARRARAWPSGNPPDGFASALAFNIYDRCITRGVLGSAFPNLYSAGMEILQAPGLVVIRHEMIHETRLVPLDGRPHLPASMRSFMGDPRGRWDGQTLVVETTNFNGRTGSYGRNGNGNPTSEALRLVERFTRRDADTLFYEVTVHDPQTWTRPWTVAFPLRREPDYVMYEYACHEGNYALSNMLRVSRALGK